MIKIIIKYMWELGVIPVIAILACLVMLIYLIGICVHFCQKHNIPGSKINNSKRINLDVINLSTKELNKKINDLGSYIIHQEMILDRKDLTRNNANTKRV